MPAKRLAHVLPFLRRLTPTVRRRAGLVTALAATALAHTAADARSRAFDSLDLITAAAASGAADQTRECRGALTRQNAPPPSPPSPPLTHRPPPSPRLPVPPCSGL
jgi:hypothetical protein